MNDDIVFYGFAAIATVVWLVICISKYRKWADRRKKCTRELDVRVVDVLERKTTKGSFYKPVFQPLNASSGEVIDTAFFSNLVSFEVGETLTLLVNPENPKQFLYKDQRLNKGLAADIIGCVAFPIGIIVFILLRSM